MNDLFPLPDLFSIFSDAVCYSIQSDIESELKSKRRSRGIEAINLKIQVIHFVVWGTIYPEDAWGREDDSEKEVFILNQSKYKHTGWSRKYFFQLNMHIFKYKMEDWLTNEENKKFQQKTVQISVSNRFSKLCLEIYIILIAITLKHWLKISIIWQNVKIILYFYDVVNNSLFVNYRMCSQLTELDSLLADLNSFR